MQTETYVKRICEGSTDKEYDDCAECVFEDTNDLVCTDCELGTYWVFFEGDD